MLLYIYKLYTTDKRYEDKRITLKLLYLLYFTLFALSKKKMSKIIIFFIQSYDLIKYYIYHNVVLR